VAASSAGFDVVCGEVIEPQPDAPNPPNASAMAVAAIPFESDVSLIGYLIPPIIPAASGESRSILSTFIIIKYHICHKSYSISYN
jgi:hypothetical protein